MKALEMWVLILLVTSSFSTADDAPVVKTLDGLISGVEEESTKGRAFYSYYSIPFAEPPLGELRFKNPLKGRGWAGVRDGTKWPQHCSQISEFGLQGGENLSGSEDCLYLNVFRPKPRPNDESARLPVMVFIHGGGFFIGGSQEYPPHVMMNHDLILVTLQYRLGLLGFLSTEDSEAPGNMGLKDQSQALTWIHHNIHLFGGDPEEVTIVGSSAGAASAHYHVMSPWSDGLFKRAILQSGTALCSWAHDSSLKAVAKDAAKALDCPTDQGSSDMISCMQMIPVNDLVRIQQQFNIWYMNPFRFIPRVDGDFIPEEPELLMKKMKHQMIDIISGVNTHEGGLYTIPIYATEEMRSSLLQNFSEIGPISLQFQEGDVSPLEQTFKIFHRYVGGVKVDAESADALTRMYGDRYFTIGHDLVSSLHAKNTETHGKKVYSYEFSYRGQRSINDMYGITIGKDYVSHADELFYLFYGGPLWSKLETEDDLKMSDILSTLWANFVRYGNPTPDDSLGFKWDPVTKDHLSHLNIQLTPVMKDDYRSEDRQFWSSLPLKQNFLLHPERVSEESDDDDFLKKREL